MARVYNLKKYQKRRQDLRNNSTETEKILWSCLKSKALGVKFRRQFGVGQYILDFYSPECRLGIELDGSVHDSEEQQAYDFQRQQRIESANIDILRFKNFEVRNNLSFVLKTIKGTILTLKNVN